MAYRGQRHSVLASQYGIVLDILEATGWTYQEWLAQPTDLTDEMVIRFLKRTKAQQPGKAHGKKR